MLFTDSDVSFGLFPLEMLVSSGSREMEMSHGKKHAQSIF